MKLVDILTNAEIALPNSLLWTDEFSWNPSVSEVSYSLSGALLVDVATRQKGRPITLEPPSEEMAWVKRSTASLLKDWTSPADRKMRLVLEYPTDTRQFIVMFRHNEAALEASPVKGFPEHNADAWFSVTIRLIEVE